MERSELSDQITINDQGEEATWQHERHRIAHGFLAVDLRWEHLSEGGFVVKSGSLAFKSRPLIARSCNGRD